MKKLFILFIAAFALVGCCTNPPTAPTTKTVLVTVPKELLVACKSSSPPPNKQKYVSADWPEKETMLVDYSNSLATDLRKCAQTVKSVEDWNEEQKRIYPNQ
jgi:uncharacterized protein YcfL